jgi:hypothetical protein
MQRLLQIDRSWMVLWILGTITGWIIGIVVVAVISQLFGLILMAYAILNAIAVGAFVGLLQWHLALKSKVNRVAWAFATVCANIFIVSSIEFAEQQQIIPQIFEYYSVGLCETCDPARLDETWLSGAVLYSLIAGLAAAVPTGIALFQYGSRPPNLWILG